MGKHFYSAEDEAREVARRTAEWPFACASRAARMNEMREGGHVFGGCSREEQTNEPAFTQREAKARAEEWAKRWEHGPEGPHFVECGHKPSHVPMHRWNRLAG